jgi:hypothetical protein
VPPCSNENAPNRLGGDLLEADFWGVGTTSLLKERRVEQALRSQRRQLFERRWQAEPGVPTSQIYSIFTI